MFHEAPLNDLIGSRICHDLISPLGAIGNGLELLSMSSAGDSPELALINESIENANARIRFFRVAFGAASAGSVISGHEVRAILRDVYRGSRVRVDWSLNTDPPRGEVKLAFLLIQCLESALPWGGRLRITCTDGRWLLHASGERQKINETLWAMIDTPTDVADVTASEVHFALVQASAQRINRKIGVVVEERQIIVNF